MEAYDLALKLAYAGKRSPVPFSTSPQYTNSVPGVPVLSMLRVFLEPKNWSEENVFTVAREIARILGSGEQYDIGITRMRNEYEANTPATGVTARLMKMNPRSPDVVLRIREGQGDKSYLAHYPRLQFEETGDDFWRSLYAPGAIKPASQE